MPVREVLESLLVVEGDQVGPRSVDGIDDDGDDFHSTCVRAQHPVGEAELLGDERAVRDADGVEEGEGDRLSPQAVKRHRCSGLVDEAEWWCRRR